MAKNNLWNDEYWLLLMQLYLKKPEGVKATYSRSMVDLALELHIEPQFLYSQMLRLRSIDTPRLQHLWQTYGMQPRKLSRGVKLLRQKMGFGSAETFYEGVEVNEGFELMFKPIEQDERLKPIMLVLILDLYFRLTPITMVAETPEIQDLSRLMKIPSSLIVDVMDVFQFCDPYLNRADMMIHPLLIPCQDVWQKYANGNENKLPALAAQLKDYFK